MVFKRGFLSMIAAAAVLMTAAVSTPHFAAASDPGFGDAPTTLSLPKPDHTIQAGQNATIKLGESVRINLPVKPFVPQPQVKSDEAKLADWLTKRSGQKLTFADVEAHIKAENLTIPADILTSIKNALEEAGGKPGPSPTPHINSLIRMYRYNAIDQWATYPIPGDCGYAMGTVGSSRNGHNYIDAVTINVTRTITSSASMTFGTTAAVISAQVGFNVAEATTVSTSVTAQNVPPGGWVSALGWRMGSCVTYMYNYATYGVYYNTETWGSETHKDSDLWLSGTAFQARYIHLESR